MNEIESARNAVRRGVEKINAHPAEDYYGWDWEQEWPKRITEPLSMFNNHRCVLGQVYGSFFDGMMHLFGESSQYSWWSDDFDGRHGFNGTDNRNTYHPLEITDAWTEFLTKHREGSDPL